VPNLAMVSRSGSQLNHDTLDARRDAALKGNVCLTI